MPNSRVLFSTIACLLITVAACLPLAYAEANWPTWRGPTADGIVAEGNPPIIWSETENIKWKVKVPGGGSSTPIVWENKMFLTTANPVSQADDTAYRFNVVCLDRTSGATIWQKTAREAVPHEGHHPTGSHASYSPVTDGKFVWASFGSRGIHCYDLDGNHQWSHDLIEMETFRRFGEGSSPALAGDAIVVVADHQGQSKIFAFNKLTGDILWENDRDEVTSWSTPLVIDADGGQQIVTSATNFVRSYDPKTGRIIWQCAGLGRSVIPTPAVGFGKVYCMGGFQQPAMMAIDLGGTGDLTETEAIAWGKDRNMPDVASPLLYGDQLYIVSQIKPDLSCYNAKTGEPLFERERLEGLAEIYASPVGVAGRVYIAGRKGAVAVLKHTPEFEVLAVNTLDDGFDASPVIIGVELYLKGNEYLYCIAVED